MKSLVRVAVGLALLAGLYWAFFSGRPPADPSDVKTIADRINQTTPKDMPGVRLERASVVGSDVLRMHFTMLGAKAADVAPGTMRTEVMKGIAGLCKGGGVSDVLRAGKNVEFEYKDAAGAAIETVTIRPADCGN